MHWKKYLVHHNYIKQPQKKMLLDSFYLNGCPQNQDELDDDNNIDNDDDYDGNGEGSDVVLMMMIMMMISVIVALIFESVDEIVNCNNLKENFEHQFPVLLFILSHEQVQTFMSKSMDEFLNSPGVLSCGAVLFYMQLNFPINWKVFKSFYFGNITGGNISGIHIVCIQL